MKEFEGRIDKMQANKHEIEQAAAEVIDGPQSVVFHEAENRLHVQKAILAWCLGAF